MLVEEAERAQAPNQRHHVWMSHTRACASQMFHTHNQFLSLSLSVDTHTHAHAHAHTHTNAHTHFTRTTSFCDALLLLESSLRDFEFVLQLMSDLSSPLKLFFCRLDVSFLVTE